MSNLELVMAMPLPLIENTALLAQVFDSKRYYFYTNTMQISEIIALLVRIKYFTFSIHEGKTLCPNRNVLAIFNWQRQ